MTDSRQGIVLAFPLKGGDFNTAGDASSKVKRVLHQIGVAPEVIRRIAISTYEAEMNVIIHAWEGWLRAYITPTETKIVVVDTGPGIPNIELAMQEGYSTAPDHIREMGFGAGMGLPNIKKCASDFTITSVVGEGTKLEITIRH